MRHGSEQLSIHSAARRPRHVTGAVLVALALACCAGLTTHAVPAWSQDQAAAKPAPKPKAPVKRAAKAAPGAQKTAAAAKPMMTREEAMRLLEAGKSAYAGGNADEAVKSFSQAIVGGALDAPHLAQALYRRGSAYSAQGKTSSAISDLSQALYLGGLTEADRADARQQRGQAYVTAGMTEAAEADFKAAKASNGGTRSQTASAPQPSAGGFLAGLFGGTTTDQAAAPAKASVSAPATQVASAPPPPASLPRAQPPLTTSSVGAPAARAPQKAAAAEAPSQSGASQSEGGLGSLFGGLFGGGSSTGAAPSTPAERPSAAQTQPVAAKVATSPPVSGGKKAGVHVQVANLRSEEQARALVQKLKSTQKGLLGGGREARVERVVHGNMGTFYQVQLGPFASAQDGEQACPGLRSSGLDCLVVR